VGDMLDDITKIIRGSVICSYVKMKETIK